MTSEAMVMGGSPLTAGNVHLIGGLTPDFDDGARDVSLYVERRSGTGQSLPTGLSSTLALSNLTYAAEAFLTPLSVLGEVFSLVLNETFANVKYRLGTTTATLNTISSAEVAPSPIVMEQLDMKAYSILRTILDTPYHGEITPDFRVYDD